LHLALEACNVGPGDEVITTPLTFCATINTILHTGAKPVLVDIDDEGNLDPEKIQLAITDRTKAIVPVHLAGSPCKMREIHTVAREHGLLIIEDAAHAVGTMLDDARIGGHNSQLPNQSDAVAFSFYATKNLTTGEGGMVTTQNESLYNRMRCLCLHGISRDAWARYSSSGSWRYDVRECGFKYNLSDLQSAVGIHQLRKQETFRNARALLAELYSTLLADVAEVITPEERQGTRHAWHLYILRLRVPSETRRSQIIEILRAREIGTSVHFIPIPLHSFYQKIGLGNTSVCPRAIDFYNSSISLPLYPAMTEQEIVRVVDGVKAAICQTRALVASA
jgi:dTDP-4-amino-4,6-dideoxygalactose transaminase